MTVSVAITDKELAILRELAEGDRRLRKLVEKTERAIARRARKAEKERLSTEGVFTVWDYIQILRGALGDRLLVPPNPPRTWGYPLTSILRRDGISFPEAHKIAGYLSSWRKPIDIGFCVHRAAGLLAREAAGSHAEFDMRPRGEAPSLGIGAPPEFHLDEQDPPRSDGVPGESPGESKTPDRPDGSATGGPGWFD